MNDIEEGFERKRSWPNRGNIPVLPGGTEEGQEVPHSGQPASRPRFEMSSTRIRVSSGNVTPIRSVITTLEFLVL
jgi:hypothetical protein